MTPWIVTIFAFVAYGAFLYFSQKWMNEHIRNDHWWDKYPKWYGWFVFFGWLPVLSFTIGFLRTFSLAQWLFAGEEYPDDYSDNIPDLEI